MGINVDSKKIKNRIIFEEEKVRIRRVFKIKINNRNRFGELFLISDEYLAIIIRAEIQIVKIINGALRKSRNNLLIESRG